MVKKADAAPTDGQTTEQEQATTSSTETSEEVIAEQAATSDPAKKNSVKLVPMVRNAEQFPEGPHTADVHPDEVDNYKTAGWTVK